MLGPKSNVYLDDIQVAGDEVQECLADTAKAVRRIAEAGGMVNLDKSHVCTTQAKIVGHRWESGGYFKAEGKGLRGLLSLDHPQLAEMSRARLYGIVSIYRDYLPDFASRTEPLRKLLSEDSQEWTETHSHQLRKIVEDILGAVPTLNFQAGVPARLEVHTGPIGIGGVLL